MNLVLVCTAVVLLISAVELVRPARRRRRNSIEQIYKEANVTPVPKMKLELNYGDYEVTLGMEVPPEYALGLPVFGFQFNPDCYYTFIMMSPDWPSPDFPILSPSLMGMYVNLYENSDGCVLLEKSCEIATLLGPSPPPGTGIHRYVLYVYKQNEMIDTTDQDLGSYQTVRYGFSLSDFVENYDLISPPAGGCIYYSQYPKSQD